jgi:transposase InsO family protein
MRSRELAMARPRFGYQRIHVLLRREGWAINRKRVHRLYRLEGLQAGAAAQAPELASRPGAAAEGGQSALEH